MVLSLASGPPALALHGKAGQLGAARAPPGRKKKRRGGKKKRRAEGAGEGSPKQAKPQGARSAARLGANRKANRARDARFSTGCPRRSGTHGWWGGGCRGFVSPPHFWGRKAPGAAGFSPGRDGGTATGARLLFSSLFPPPAPSDGLGVRCL